MINFIIAGLKKTEMHIIRQFVVLYEKKKPFLTFVY